MTPWQISYERARLARLLIEAGDLIRAGREKLTELLVNNPMITAEVRAELEAKRLALYADSVTAVREADDNGRCDYVLSGHNAMAYSFQDTLEKIYSNPPGAK